MILTYSNATAWTLLAVISIIIFVHFCFYDLPDLRRQQVDNDAKYILTWCEAYGSLKYGWDFGEEKLVIIASFISFTVTLEPPEHVLHRHRVGQHQHIKKLRDVCDVDDIERTGTIFGSHHQHIANMTRQRRAFISYSLY